MLEEALYQLGRTLDDKADAMDTLEAFKQRHQEMTKGEE